MPIQAVVAPAPPGQITIQVPGVATPQAIYRAAREQRDVLGDQLSALQRERGEVERQLGDLSTPSASKPGLEKRLEAIDARITDMDKQIAQSDALVAQAAGTPGATTPPPRRDGPDPDMVVGYSGLVALAFAIPIAIAYARRIWRRSAKTEVVLPPEMAERMAAMERGVEAVAIEVERIGESQRFLTQALADRGEIRALGGAKEPVPVARHRES